MHMRNTKNRDCHIGYQQGLRLAGFYDVGDEDDIYGPQDEADTLDHFQGDLFGKYDEHDSEWPNDDDGMLFSLLVITIVLILMTIQWMLKTRRVRRMEMRMKRMTW